MTICTSYFAFPNFFLYSFYAVVVADHVGYGFSFLSLDVIEFKYDRVTFTAIDATIHLLYPVYKLLILLFLLSVPGRAPLNDLLLVSFIVPSGGLSLIFFAFVRHAVLSIGFEPMTYEL